MPSRTRDAADRGAPRPPRCCVALQPLQQQPSSPHTLVAAETGIYRLPILVSDECTYQCAQLQTLSTTNIHTLLCALSCMPATRLYSSDGLDTALTRLDRSICAGEGRRPPRRDPRPRGACFVSPVASVGGPRRRVYPQQSTHPRSCLMRTDRSFSFLLYGGLRPDFSLMSE